MSHSAQTQKRQVSVLCVTLVFVQDMKKQELYSISHNGKILAEGLTEEEYMDKMQDLADEFFEKGTPHPLELRTDVKEEEI